MKFFKCSLKGVIRFFFFYTFFTLKTETRKLHKDHKSLSQPGNQTQANGLKRSDFLLPFAMYTPWNCLKLNHNPFLNPYLSHKHCSGKAMFTYEMPLTAIYLLSFLDNLNLKNSHIAVQKQIINIWNGQSITIMSYSASSISVKELPLRSLSWDLFLTTFL